LSCQGLFFPITNHSIHQSKKEYQEIAAKKAPYISNTIVCWNQLRKLGCKVLLVFEGDHPINYVNLDDNNLSGICPVGVGMFYRYAADAVLFLHFSFILFAVFGGLLAVWRRWFYFIHLPATTWGVFVELTGRVCPLTSLENTLRIKAGAAAYSKSFVEHYLLGIIYPDGLTREIQYFLGILVVVVNAAIYLWLFYRFRQENRRDA
jgi:hypothetical protein